MTTQRLRIVRPFNWGLLLIGDQGAAELPTEPPTGPSIAVATRSAVAIGVRHAQDTDLAAEPAVVRVDVIIGIDPDHATDYATELDIRSGVLQVGDAEGVDELTIEAGRWRLAVIARPADHPDGITIWLSRHRV